jgi:hypothetical protein
VRVHVRVHMRVRARFKHSLSRKHIVVTMAPVELTYKRCDGPGTSSFFTIFLLWLLGSITQKELVTMILGGSISNHRPEQRSGSNYRNRVCGVTSWISPAQVAGHRTTRAATSNRKPLYMRTSLPSSRAPSFHPQPPSFPFLSFTSRRLLQELS